jgi:CBS domain-containing protein
MFSIYGVTGQVFSGTLEEMNRVNALARTRAARAIAQDGEEPGIEAILGASTRLREDAVKAYRSMLPRDLERGPLYHAGQIMQTTVIRVNAGDSVAHAWRTLRDHAIRQAPVMDDDARLVGIVSERDLLTALNIEGGLIVESLGRLVRDVMTTPVVAAVPVTDIRRIAAVMIDKGVDGVPITNETGRLLGFVSRGDILRAVVTDPPLSLWR